MKKIQILRILILYSIVDMLVYYPPRLYLLSWFPRIFAQVTFFAIIADFVGGQAFLHYSLIGNSFYILVSSLIIGVAISVTWERRAGTLPLLIASPTHPLFIFSGRNVGMALHGLINGLVSIYIIAPILGVHLGIMQVFALLLPILFITISSYGVGLLLGAISLYTRGYHNVVSNFIVFTILVLCGVNYPVSTLPQALQIVAWFLPLTHGLQAARLLLDGNFTSQIIVLLCQELIVGVLYALLAQLLIGKLIFQARSAGTLEYS